METVKIPNTPVVQTVTREQSDGDSEQEQEYDELSEWLNFEHLTHSLLQLTGFSYHLLTRVIDLYSVGLVYIIAINKFFTPQPLYGILEPI